MTEVSIVLPAYNEAGLGRFLGALRDAGAVHPNPPVEFVVVDDASSPDRLQSTRDAVREVAARGGRHHVFRLVEQRPNQGKGAAIRHGWRETDPGATWTGFVDADGAISASELFRVVGMLGETAADVVCGSRIRMAGRHIERRLFRHLQGRVFATVVDQVFRLGLYDTQCGIKLLRTAVVHAILDRLEESRWMLDVELLVRARQAGATIVEVPIDWVDAGGSKVRFGIDPLTMLWGLRRMRRRLGR